MTQPTEPPDCGPLRWGVVSTVREPAVLVLGFACHHLALGAERVHLFFDDPDDPAADVLAGVPGVSVTRCDQDHWASFGYRGRPQFKTKRQTLNANLVMAESDLAWLLHSDADELLWTPRPVAEMLAEVPGGLWLRVPNVERCWLADADDQVDIYGGVFRSSLVDLPDLEEQVYGPRARGLFAGLCGYSDAKAFARVGEGFLAIHKVREAEGGAERPRTDAPARILHFDGITPEQWALKILRYAGQGLDANSRTSAQRKALVGTVMQASNPRKTAARLYEALFTLSQDEAAALRDAGRLHTYAIDIRSSIARIAPHLSPDTSRATFDALIEEELAGFSRRIVRRRRKAARGD